MYVKFVRLIHLNKLITRKRKLPGLTSKRRQTELFKHFNTYAVVLFIIRWIDKVHLQINIFKGQPLNNAFHKQTMIVPFIRRQLKDCKRESRVFEWFVEIVRVMKPLPDKDGKGFSCSVVFKDVQTKEWAYISRF